jgi:opacity protein-like surface antigen
MKPTERLLAEASAGGTSFRQLDTSGSTLAPSKRTMLIRFRLIVFGTALVVLTLGLPAPSAAQSFISPLLGYDFGEDSSCPAITGCEDKNLNVGAGIGSLGPFFGLELDVSYAKDFFGAAPGYSSSVLTVMGDLIAGPQIGRVRPYATGGIGLIKSHVSANPTSLLDSSNNDFGWNIGGGVMVFMGEHIGVRGDIRHFHSFQDLEILGLPLSDTKLGFGRASAALVFRF